MSGPFRNDDNPNVEPADEEFRTWLTDRHCPVCRVSLYAARRKGIGVDACGGCGGVWLGSEDARRLAATKDPALARIATAAVEGSEKRAPSNEPRACPDCRKGLRLGFLSQGNVNVDVCDDHGTWFDAYELNAFCDHLTKSTPRSEFDRAPEFETPFVALVKKVVLHLKRALPGG